MNETSDTPTTPPLAWDRLSEMSDPALAALVDCAIFVLGQADEAGTATAPAQMPPGALIHALEQSLNERGLDTKAAVRVVRQSELSRPVAILLLKEISTEPALVEEIERVWRERSAMLFVGTATVLAAALLLLVVKLKKLKINRNDGVQIDFDKVSTGALGAVFKFIGM